MLGYYYLHTNGQLIYKTAFVVDSDPSYFDSPFVKKHWHFDTTERGDGWKIVLEAFALGGLKNRVKELAIKWELTLEDFIEFMKRNPEPNELMQKGIVLFAENVLDISEDELWDKIAKLNGLKRPSKAIAG